MNADTILALSDPASAMYREYAADMRGKGFAVFAAEANARAFAQTWGRRVHGAATEVGSNRDGRWVVKIVFPTWTFEDMAAGVDPRRSTGPVASAEDYERAIQRMEQTFRRNKSRMWVLKCLRDAIEQERTGDERAVLAS